MQTPFICLIPARMASTRLPQKPLANIAGKAMVVHVAKRAKQSGAERVIVATDHEEIIKVCVQEGIEACLTAPELPSGTDRIAAAAEQLQLPNDAILINVQGDEPLIEPGIITQLAKKMQDGHQMATIAHRLSDIDELFDSNLVKLVLNHKGEALYFSRAPIPWYRDLFAQSRDRLKPDGVPLKHVGIYAYTHRFLKQITQLPLTPLEQIEGLEQLRVLFYGHPIAVHVTDHKSGISVDTPADLARVQRLMELNSF